MIKPIKNFPNYYISDTGDVYSTMGHSIKKLKPWVDSKGRYLQIRLISNGKHCKKLVHRIVAEAFIPNPLNLPEIHHIDNNPQNNNVLNLQWCDRKFNLKESYKTMSPVRNNLECYLLKNKDIIGEFKSVLDAANYAAKTYNLSKSSLRKYYRCKNFSIIFKHKNV